LLNRVGVSPPREDDDSNVGHEFARTAHAREAVHFTTGQLEFCDEEIGMVLLEGLECTLGACHLGYDLDVDRFEDIDERVEPERLRIEDHGGSLSFHTHRKSRLS
jgi:hypothetical protein